METQVYATTRYLELTKAIVFDKRISLLMDKTESEKWVSNTDVIAQFGAIALQNLRDYPYFFYSGNINEVGSWDNWGGVIGYFFGYVSYVTKALWFVKDNSVNVDFVFLYSKGNDVFLNRRPQFLISNAEGSIQDVAFEPSDFKEAIDFSSRYFALTPSLTNDERDRELHGGQSLSAINYIEHKSHNRLARAYMFLDQARQVSYLPIKISFYIACLESLFTTDNSEVTHKVRERVACFIANNREDKIRIFEEVRKGYDVRSTFMHGSSLKKFSELSRISIGMDDIIRTLFIKILDKPELFVDVKKDFRDYNSETLGKYFNDMVLNGNPF